MQESTLSESKSLSPPASAIIDVEGLGVSYGRDWAVQGLSLKLEKGQALGLLGANGAGKTTTLRTILGILKPREGSVRVFGQLPGTVPVLARLGYAPETACPPEFLSGMEYLRFVASFRKSESEVGDLLDSFQLDPKKRISNYSKGMRRRLVLAQAFVGKPDLLILDEPLSGLDPIVILSLREKITAYVAAGGTVMFSSHILAEVEKVCSHVAMLKQGTLVCFSPVKPLLEEFGSVESAFSSKVKGGGAP